MAPEQDPQTLLSTFIADEDAALRARQWGQLWPRHHYSIRAAVAKASRYLEPTDRQQLYFHLLRVTGGIPDVPDKELPDLVAGYRKLIPLLDTSAVRGGRASQAALRLRVRRRGNSCRWCNGRREAAQGLCQAHRPLHEILSPSRATGQDPELQTLRASWGAAFPDPRPSRLLPRQAA